MYGPIRGRSIPWRTVRRRPCSRLRFPGLWSAGLRLRLARLCLYWARVGGARGLGTCRRLLWTSGVASPGFGCRCGTIAGLRSSALGRPGLRVVLWLLRTILGVRRGWQRPDETTGETAEGEPGQQPERSCLHRYGFPFRCWKNVARVGASRGRRQSRASICLRWMQYVGGRALSPRKTAFARGCWLRREGNPL
jgi:hypothetical protein